MSGLDSADWDPQAVRDLGQRQLPPVAKHDDQTQLLLSEDSAGRLHPSQRCADESPLSRSTSSTSSVRRLLRDAAASDRR